MSDRSVDSAWEQLRRHLDWVKDPWVGFVCASGGRLSGELAERARVHLEQSGRKLRVHKPDSAEALRTVAVELLDEPADASTCVWLEGVRFGASASGEDPWENAWLWLLQRLNEHRERILRTLQGGLVLALPRPMKSEVAATAPDLWSVRALSLDVDEARASIGWSSPPLLSLQFAEESVVDLSLARTDVTTLTNRVAELERDAEASPEEKRAARVSLAAAEHELAIALAQRGERDAALKQCTKAVEELRDLARPVEIGDAPSVWAHLAGALHTLTSLYDGAGPLDRMVDLMEECVDILRKLADTDPRFRSRFALGLSQLLLLRRLTRRDDGSAVLQEWLDLPWEEVATSDDVAPMADALRLFGSALTTLEDRARALELTSVLTSHYRRLVAHHPGQFEAGLASVLSNLGERLAAVGRADEALDTLKEGVALYRQVADDLPEPYQIVLAVSLNRLANAHRALGQDAEALAVDQEAEALRAQERLAAMLGKLGDGEN